jgi:hypothetical protein
VELLVTISNVIVFTTSGELTVTSLAAKPIENLVLETVGTSWFAIRLNQFLSQDLGSGDERVFIVDFIDHDRSSSVHVRATAIVDGDEQTSTHIVR